MIKYDIKMNNGVEAFGTTEKTLTACEHVENVDAKFMAHHMHLHNALIPEDVATAVLNAFCESAAELSLRQWADKPYRSKTQEIVRLTASDGVGIQILEFDKDRDGMVSWNFFDIDGKYPSLEDVAYNDGLSLEDWKAWFKDYNFSHPLAVIHFTPFRY